MSTTNIMNATNTAGTANTTNTTSTTNLSEDNVKSRELYREVMTVLDMLKTPEDAVRLQGEIETLFPKIEGLQEGYMSSLEETDIDALTDKLGNAFEKCMNAQYLEPGAPKDLSARMHDFRRRNLCIKAHRLNTECCGEDTEQSDQARAEGLYRAIIGVLDLEWYNRQLLDTDLLPEMEALYPKMEMVIEKYYAFLDPQEAGAIQKRLTQVLEMYGEFFNKAPEESELHDEIKKFATIMQAYLYALKSRWYKLQIPAAGLISRLKLKKSEKENWRFCKQWKNIFKDYF